MVKVGWAAAGMTAVEGATGSGMAFVFGPAADPVSGPYQPCRSLLAAARVSEPSWVALQSDEDGRERVSGPSRIQATPSSSVSHDTTRRLHGFLVDADYMMTSMMGRLAGPLSSICFLIEIPVRQ